MHFKFTDQQSIVVHFDMKGKGTNKTKKTAFLHKFDTFFTSKSRTLTTKKSNVQSTQNITVHQDKISNVCTLIWVYISFYKNPL